MQFLELHLIINKNLDEDKKKCIFCFLYSKILEAPGVIMIIVTKLDTVFLYKMLNI